MRRLYSTVTSIFKSNRCLWRRFFILDSGLWAHILPIIVCLHEYSAALLIPGHVSVFIEWVDKILWLPGKKNPKLVQDGICSFSASEDWFSTATCLINTGLGHQILHGLFNIFEFRTKGWEVIPLSYVYVGLKLPLAASLPPLLLTKSTCAFKVGGFPTSNSSSN